MAWIADAPCPWRMLYSPAGRVGGDQGGWGASLGFHVGANVVGGQPTDMVPFLQFVGGTSETITFPGGVTATRIVPLRHPYMPDMVAVAARAEGTGRGIDAAPGWTDWKVTIDFGLVPYAFSGDQPYMTIRRSYGATSVTLPGQALRVGGVPIPHDVAITIPEIAYSFTKYNVPSLDDSVFKVLQGKVNASTFLGYPAETVRFDGVQDEITQTIAFTTNRTVTLALVWRPRSWNQVMMPTGAWATPTNASDGSKLYATGNFDLLYA